MCHARWRVSDAGNKRIYQKSRNIGKTRVNSDHSALTGGIMQSGKETGDFIRDWRCRKVSANLDISGMSFSQIPGFCWKSICTVSKVVH